MKHHPDDSIDQVLSALRHAQPAPGMQQRLHETLQAHASAKPRSALERWISSHTALLRRHVRLPFAAIALVILAVVAVVRPHMRPHPSVTASAPHVIAAGKTSSPAIVSLPSLPKSPALTSATARRKPSPTPQPYVRDDRNDLDQIAAEELRAPSQPAPPLPLTREELLLLRVAHHARSEPLDVLNNDLRARQEAVQEADFDKFFGKLKPPPIGNE